MGERAMRYFGLGCTPAHGRGARRAGPPVGMRRSCPPSNSLDEETTKTLRWVLAVLFGVVAAMYAVDAIVFRVWGLRI